jgi:hypothetical protein
MQVQLNVVREDLFVITFNRMMCMLSAMISVALETLIVGQC